MILEVIVLGMWGFSAGALISQRTTDRFVTWWLISAVSTSIIALGAVGV